MKTLVLLRHGKSDWEAEYASDAERPLTKRGRKAAATMGLVLTRLGEWPERVLSSPAVRARTTVELASEAGGFEGPIGIEPALYDATVESVLAFIQEQDDAASSLLLAGHEPTWSSLAGALIGGGSLAFPTAGLACIDLDVPSWRAVEPGCGRLRFLVNPRFVQAVAGEP